MKYITHPKGYTIVELLVVITVMGVVAISAIGVIGNQQARTELPHSVRDFEAKLLDVANDTARGYYPDTGQAGEGRTCLASGSGISFTSDVSVQGGSRDCVFAGKALAFAPDGEVGEFAVLTVAARRLTRDDNPATSLADFSSGDIAVADHLNTSLQLLYGLQVKSVTYAGADVGALVFMSGFSNQEQRSGGVQLSGAPQTNLLAITGTSVGSALSVTQSAISGLQFNEVTNDEGIVICLQRGDGGETAEVTVGKDGRLLTTTAEFKVAC